MNTEIPEVKTFLAEADRLVHKILDEHSKRLLYEDEQRRIDEWAGRINDNRREYAFLFDENSFFVNRKLMARLVTGCGYYGQWFLGYFMFTQRACIMEAALKMRERELLTFGG